MEERKQLQDIQQPKQQLQHCNPSPPLSSSSAASSPSHEFSFTISLHNKHCSMSSPPSSHHLTTTVDLSPADEIFFHGHLLPLHLLSHLPRVSPHASASGQEDQNSHVDDNETDTIYQTCGNSGRDFKEGRKSKSFSPFKISSKLWRKDQSKPNPQNDDVSSHYDIRRTRVLKFKALKKFLKSIKLKPGFFSLIRRDNRDEFIRQKQQQQHYSAYSGNLRMRSKKETIGGRRRADQFSSAPVPMRNSPTNSGVLVESGTVSPTTKSDSTMEELQAAIQAAIAHCKKSIAADEKMEVQ